MAVIHFIVACKSKWKVGEYNHCVAEHLFTRAVSDKPSTGITKIPTSVISNERAFRKSATGNY
jgi:hypothetical protein